MSNKTRREQNTVGKQRPFPWRCAECGREDVVPTSTSYTGQVNYDGRLYTVNISSLEIPTCRQCGERVFTNRVEESISAALRAQLHLLTPEQIESAIELLGMEPNEAAQRLGIHEDALSTWIAGTVIQPRAMDNLLRAFFASPQVRAALTGPEQDPQFGVLPVPAAR